MIAKLSHVNKNKGVADQGLLSEASGSEVSCTVC